MAVTLATCVMRLDDVHEAQMGQDQIALLSLKGGEYFGVEGSAARIWKLLANETSVEAINRQIASDYGLSPEDCEADTIAFVAELVSENLVRITHPG